MLELRDESICGKYQFYKDALSGKYGIRDWKIDRVILRPVFDKIEWHYGNSTYVILSVNNKEAAYNLKQLESLM